MKRKLVSSLLCVAMVATMLAGCGGSSDSGSSDSGSAEDTSSGDGETQGTNTFVDGGTELSLWTFQELHVGFWTEMADKWNEENPDNPINLTVTTGESHSVQQKLLVACQAGEGTPDIADIEIGYYGSFLKDDYLLPLNDVVEPYQNDVVMSVSRCTATRRATGTASTSIWEHLYATTIWTS